MIQLVIGNKNYSTWSLRAWLALRKADIAFEEIRVPLYVDGYKEELLRHGPAGLVPVFKDGDFVLWDSLAICEFAAEMRPALWPADARRRAHARAISAEMHSGFRAIRSQIPMNCRARRQVAYSGEVLAEIRRVEAMWTQCRQHPSAADGGWLFGQFSIADAMYAPLVLHFDTYGVSLNPIASAYMKQVRDDADVRAWVADALREMEMINECEVGVEQGG